MKIEPDFKGVEVELEVKITPVLLQVVICKQCGEPEYYGCMLYIRRRLSCRRCLYATYGVQKDAAKSPKSQQPEKVVEGIRFVYPIYEDGIDRS